MTDIRFLNDEQRKQIGFDFIMEKLEVLTPYGMERKRGLKPIADRDELEKELEYTETVVLGMDSDIGPYHEIERIFRKVKDIRGSLKRCEDYEILDSVEFYEIKLLCLLMRELTQILETSDINIESAVLDPVDDVIDILDPDGRYLPTFHIYESYSQRLKKIREEKRELEGKIRLEKDVSKIKELKRKRLDIVVLEDEEELDIRRSLTERISEYTSSLNHNLEAVGSLDIQMAKAKLALKYGAVKPNISENMMIDFQDMINPEIMEMLSRKGRKFTPVSMFLKSGTTVVTGANMGGKSVALKTLVLNLFLGQMGFFVFCREACLPLVDFIYLISDDMQSVSRGLSTFGAEIVELKEALETIKSKRGLIAMDEFARGTNPAEGCNLAKSLCRFLLDFETISVMSTHYDGVVEEGMTHYQVIGLKNTDLNLLRREFEVEKRHSAEIIQSFMDYRLERVSIDSRVPCDALNICVLLGFEQKVIDIAKQLYDWDKDGEGKNHGKQIES